MSVPRFAPRSEGIAIEVDELLRRLRSSRGEDVDFRSARQSNFALCLGAGGKIKRSSDAVEVLRWSGNVWRRIGRAEICEDADLARVVHADDPAERGVVAGCKEAIAGAIRNELPVATVIRIGQDVGFVGKAGKKGNF